MHSPIRFLQHGRRALLLLVVALLLAGGGGCPNSNNAPRIDSLTADPPTLRPQGTTVITCVASDPDGDSLTYAWTENGWVISGGGGILTWTAPNTPGVYTIGVTVSDGNGGTASRSVQVEVIARPPVPTPTPEPTPTPTPPATPTPLPTVTMTCHEAVAAIQSAINAYQSANREYPTANGGPGDIVWAKLVPGFMTAVPQNDSTCNWQVNSKPLGQVCALYC